MNFKYVLLLAIFLAASVVYSADKKKDTVKVYKTPSITVTSTRAEEGKSPVAFSEITESQIKQTYTVADIPVFLNEQTSVLMYTQSGNSVGYTNLNIRGFDQRRISVMINGIPQNDPEDHNVYWIDFPDLMESLDNIQIQRGAGTSSYGAAAIGGSINLQTSNFADKRGIRLYSGVGWQEYGASSTMQPTLGKYLLEVSSGLTGNYAFYGKLSRVNSEGYRDRSWAYLNSYFLSAVRFDENFTTQINVFGGPFSDGLVYNGLPKSYMSDTKLRRSNYSYWVYDETGKNELKDWTAVRRKQEIEEFSQPHYELLNDWHISDDLTFKSALFYYTGDGFFDYDASWADTTTLRITENYGFSPTANPGNALVKAYVGNKHGGWIPRIIYNHGNGEFTFGAEIRIHRSEHWGKISFAENLPAGFDPDYQFYSYDGKRNTISAFVREIYNLDDMFTMSAEAQLVRQTYAIGNEKAGRKYTSYNTIDGGTVSGEDDIFEINYTFFNPRLGVTAKLDENTTAFALLAVTSREPRMNNLYAASDAYSGAMPLFEGVSNEDGSVNYDFSKPLVKPERMLDIEFGATYRDTKYFVSANAYAMLYSDELVKSGKLDLFGDPVVGNAPKTEHIGIELQASALVMNCAAGKLTASANMTVSSNKIVEFDFLTDEGEKISLKDNPIAGFPDFMAAFRIGYEWESLYFGLTCKHVGQYRTDNYGDLILTNEKLKAQMSSDFEGYYADNTLDAYTVFNADLSYTFKNVLSFNSVRFQLQVNNLTNLLYAAGAEGKEFFPAAERNVFLGIEVQM